MHLAQISPLVLSTTHQQGRLMQQNMHVVQPRRRIYLQCRRPGFNRWVRNIPWRRERLPIPVPLPGEFHRQRSLAGYSPWGHKEWGTTEWITLSLFLLFSFFHFQDLNNVVILLFNLIPLYPPSVSPCFFPCALNDVINAKIWTY